MFRRIWRNSKVKLALELASGVATSVVVGVAVLNHIDAYFNVSMFGYSGWLEYAFFGVCSMLVYFWVKNRKP